MPAQTPPPTFHPALRSPHTYLHLALLSSLPTTHQPPPLDNLTAHTYFTAALKQFLGITGTAIPIDILKVEGRDVWVRCPREDGAAVVAALGGWSGEGGKVGWRVKGRGDYLGVVGAGGGGEVWDD